MAGDTKARITGAGAELLRRQGYTGTGLKQIVATSGATLGSIYHFFPGGKEQLGEEIIRVAGAAYGELVMGILGEYPDPVTAIESAFTRAADTLAETGYADACPIATVALEVASTHEGLRRATAEVFTAWIEAGTDRFVRWGLSPTDAREVTLAMLTSLEGAFVLARALRDTEPLHVAGRTVAALVASRVP